MYLKKPFFSEKLLWINQNNIYLNQTNHLNREFVQFKFINFKIKYILL